MPDHRDSLRHFGYYRGILFLTTNRVHVFDLAFMSRIHLALRFKELSREAKLKIWQAFLQKVTVEGDVLTQAELDDLVGRRVNGRQIKNATKTATSLAQSRGGGQGSATVQTWIRRRSLRQSLRA
ncbi:hypothetical protein C8Q72DRAFT_268825 [Fomitopsis betulina]|nr:hypothetical protein C8Q72DRAFT_268825 [Fomitopsis betulina]